MSHRLTRPSIVFSLVLAASLCLPGFRSAHAFAPPAGYDVEDIGQPKSATGGVRGQALNDDGTIAGVATTDSGQRPVLYKRGKFTYLDGATGMVTVGDISDDDVVVGAAGTDPNGADLAPMVWRHEEITKLPGLGGDAGIAYAINEEGTIVGIASIEPGDLALVASRATVWRNNEAADLTTENGDYSEATDLNAEGLIVGEIPRDGFSNAVLWRDGETIELGTLGGDRSSAAAINDRGQIVGESAKLPGRDASYPFLWQDDKMTELPALDAFPYAIAADLNDAGQIIGNAYDDTGSTTPVLWEGDEVYDLNTLLPAESGVTITYAVAINEAGQILCIGISDNADGERTFLLTPKK